MGLTVVTYGGGEILLNIFNAIAMLLNHHSGSFIRPFIIITASTGAVWAVSKALFSQSAQAFLTHYILPLVGVVGLLMVPTTTVHIEDVLKDRSYTVGHVPFLVGKFAELASSVGYQITKGVEKVMHVPNDVSYNKTGMIFGADNAMDISRYQLTNADLERNLRLFCKQCVLFDISLGRYTIDEMKKATDLWKFFEEKTSKVRMIRYLPVGSGGDEKLGEYLSCKQAIAKMAPYFEKEKRYYGQLDVCRNLPLTFQALTGMQKDKEELISQQLLMNVLLDEYSGKNFAHGRAYLQQRNTYQALGSLASNSLVTLRAVIEALVYASFIFILPLSVLPGGLRYIMTWLGLVVWIQLWPPFYAILNYIMQSVAHGYAETVFTGLSGANQGLSLFTSVGLHNLQQDIYALSGYLAASIPFLTYAVLKGGVGSFIHLAGSMMTPAHQAASAAASEQTTGNYSFGNSSFGQTSYKNTSGLHSNMAPSMSSGYFTENRGTSSTVYGAEEQMLKQGNSELRTSVFSDGAITDSLQKNKMHAESTAEISQQTYAESIASHARNTADLSNHLSKSESYSDGISEREAYDLQESARYFQNVSENWGKQHGLSSEQSARTLAGLGINFGVHAEANTSFGSNKQEALSSANQIVKSEEFQKNFQRLQDFSHSSSHNALDDQGVRLSESHNRSLEQMQSSQESYQVAQTQLDQASENVSWAESNSHLIRRSLNQDFVNWASEKYAGQGGYAKVEDLLTNGSTAQQEGMTQDFINHIRTNTPSYSLSSYNGNSSKSLPHTLSLPAAENAIQTFAKEHAQNFSNTLPRDAEGLKGRFEKQKSSSGSRFDQVANKIDATRRGAIEEFNHESDRSMLIRTLDQGPDLDEMYPALALAKKIGFMKKILPESKSSQAIASNFQITEEAFWMKKES